MPPFTIDLRSISSTANILSRVLLFFIPSWVSDSIIVPRSTSNKSRKFKVNLAFGLWTPPNLTKLMYAQLRALLNIIHRNASTIWLE